MQIGLDLVQSKISTFNVEGCIDEELLVAIYQVSFDLVPIIRDSLKKHFAELVFE